MSTTDSAMSYNDKFIRDSRHAEAIASGAVSTLCRLVTTSAGPKQVAIDAPPWLQGMRVLVQAVPCDTDRSYAVTLTLTPSKSNATFEPVRASVRATASEFEEVVTRAALAMLHEADQRVPAQTLADLVFRAGLANRTHRLYAAFRQAFATRCLDEGVRPVFSAMGAEAAKRLIHWFVEWATENNVQVPDVSFDQSWVTTVPATLASDDPFAVDVTETPAAVQPGEDPFSTDVSAPPAAPVSPRRVSPLN